MKPLLLIAIVLGAGIQRERIITPSEQTADETRFFDQLRLIFGRFSNTDLQDAFRKAAPIRCSELVNNRGTWRTVAFFNQDSPALGSWFRSNLEDVKRDLDAYVFSGVCNGERGSLSLTTKFPVEESVEAFNQRRIGLEEVDVNVNAAVTAVFDFQTESYVFDLPYLFFKGVQNGMNVYSLHPPLLETRDRYARAVAAHFDCKAVRSADVTYQFLICRYTLRFPNESGNLPRRSDTAYYILSDGKEATSSVRLTFGGPNPLDQGAGAVSRTSTEAPTVARPGEGPLDDPQVRSRLNVNLAQVDALARDRNGRPISNLTVSDFRLFEDGVERPIQTFSQDQLPLAIALVIDRRASVASSLPEIQKSAHKALAQLKEADMACLFAFDTGVEMLEALTHDRQGVAKRIGSISEEGRANIIYAVYAATRYLADNAPDRRRAVLLISDNVNVSGEDHTDLTNAIRRVQESETVVYSVKVDALRLLPPDIAMDRGRNPVPELTKESGGEIFDVATLGSVERAMASAIERLKTRYTLGYDPATAEANKSRRIEVRLADRFGRPETDYSVLARTANYIPLQGRPRR